MKKILVYLNPGRYSSLFDMIVAYDAEADVVIPYCSTEASEIEDIVYSCIFTRNPDDLKNTAIFIGGSDVNKGEELLKEITRAFEKLDPELRVSVVADPHGAYTASSACVVKIKNSLGNIKGMKATVLAGTGPVGQSIAVLLAKEGCDVKITSRKLSKAAAVAKRIQSDYRVKVKPVEASDDESFRDAVEGSEIVVSTGPEGVTLLPMDIWSKSARIKVLADLNAVAPAGIGEVKLYDDSRELNGKILIGPFAIGGLKIKCHREVVRQLFDMRGVIFDLGRVYNIAKNI